MDAVENTISYQEWNYHTVFTLICEIGGVSVIVYYLFTYLNSWYA